MTGTWATGWIDGDTPLVAEWPRKGVGAIYDTTLGAPAAAIDITGINQTYAHLMVEVYARGSVPVNVTSALTAILNGDAAANYDYQRLSGFAATANAGEVFAAGSWVVGNVPAGTAGANLFGTCMLFLPNYASSANNKAFVSLSAMKDGTASGNIEVDVYGGGWRSNAAVNRITLATSAGGLDAGTRITVYGMGA